MAARVAASRRFLADSCQELHEVHRSRTPDSSRRNLPLLGHRVGRDRAAGNAWKVRLLKSLSRRWAKSAITNILLLEERGFVSRNTHPTDGRARTVALTESGLRKFRQVF